MTTTASSPAKVILFGEHAVVHGHPAVVATLGLKVNATVEDSTSSSQYSEFIQNILRIFEQKYQRSTNNLKVTIHSEVPIGGHLGSSAATANALFQALLQHFEISFTQNQLLDLVYKSEQFAHGNPSGIDPTVVVYGGILAFQKKDGELTFSHIHTTAFQNTPFFLVQSGTPKENTKEMVAKVQALIDANEEKKQVLEKIGQLSQAVTLDLRHNNFNPIFITQNERLLEKIEVVGKKAQSMISQIELIGGFAKVTGGGGYQEGSGMLLAHHPQPEILRNFLQTNNWEFFDVNLGEL